ncbi:hypothetical protein IAT38_004960 [Cryptococcus sp. DSM 104549]
MALGPIHCGSFLLLAATVLLLVSTISAPVIHNISFLNIQSGSQKSTFGVFGYCSNIVGSDSCSSKALGYDIVSVTGQISSHTFANKTLEGLTKALILHPIATGLAFIAFLIALCSDHLGFLFSAFIALLAFLASLAAMAIDFALFTVIKHEINSNTSARATYSAAIWLTLAATVILFFSTFVVCFSCCTNRRARRSDREVGYGTGPTMGQTQGYQKRHWWNRSKYAY